MLDDPLPLTVGEYEEWGNPKILSSTAGSGRRSLHQPCAEGLPDDCWAHSLNDSQVMYWEPAKYVARLRTLKTDANPLVLPHHTWARGMGAPGRYDRAPGDCPRYAFVLWRLVHGTPDS